MSINKEYYRIRVTLPLRNVNYNVNFIIMHLKSNKIDEKR